jgi:uncharacterized protein YciI
MFYFCFCKDHPGSLELRAEHAPAHLAYIETILDKIAVAGPLIKTEPDNFNASCFIYQTDSQEEALELLHNDPYFKAGIYAEVHSQPFLPAAGTWIGGKIW